jgi:hypothetical protein
MKTEFTELTQLETVEFNSVKNHGGPRAAGIANQKSKIENEVWLPDMDLNHDKQIQSLLCYRYTIGQAGAGNNLEGFVSQSSRQTSGNIICGKS